MCIFINVFTHFHYPFIPCNIVAGTECSTGDPKSQNVLTKGCKNCVNRLRESMRCKFADERSRRSISFCLLTLLKKEQRTTLQIKQLAGNKKYNSFQNHMKYFKHYNFGKLCYVLSWASQYIYYCIFCSLYADKNVLIFFSPYMFHRTASVE